MNLVKVKRGEWEDGEMAGPVAYQEERAGFGEGDFTDLWSSKKKKKRTST